MLRGVIFDLDGVIVDSHPAHMQAWKAFFVSLGKPVSDHDLNFVQELKLVNGLVGFLEQIETARLPVALASSASRSRAEFILDQLDLKSYFKVVVTGDDVARGKPDPTIFNMAAKGIGVPPAGVLVCEDAVNGVEAAKTAGMKCLGIAANGRGPIL